ncbi:MAG: hypothetical protein DRG83_00570 [Deltaproteobacteria bacterium]|nr:MAG: hypothetical protein DRG83_00570 [Deltaproteobacteria bacterium]
MDKKEIVNTTLERCIACKSTNIRWCADKEDINGIKWSIFRCLNCGTGFINPRPTLSYLQKIYTVSGHGLKEPISLMEVLERERVS